MVQPLRHRLLKSKLSMRAFDAKFEDLQTNLGTYTRITLHTQAQIDDNLFTGAIFKQHLA